jgi:hypothetical protein
LIILETKFIMSHIRIIDITPSPNLEQLSATLTVATIDDVTGSIVSQPHQVAKGSLNIRSLVALNNQIIKNFQAATTQDRWRNSNPRDNGLPGSRSS